MEGEAAEAALFFKEFWFMKIENRERENRGLKKKPLRALRPRPPPWMPTAFSPALFCFLQKPSQLNTSVSQLSIPPAFHPSAHYHPRSPIFSISQFSR